LGTKILLDFILLLKNFPCFTTFFTTMSKGTICAILTTTAAYLACVVLSGLACDGALMRDKFGDSLSRGDGLQ